MDQKDRLDDDSVWPARLLHVHTLISYPREPGDIYGGYVKPRYNAISYTWGRFALQKQENPEVKAAPIKGTTWVDYIPRMNPARYTVQELEHAIKTAAYPHDGYPAVDFLWLDIACINQTPNSPEMAREVGRQVKIFRGATDTFVWLTTLTSAGMLSWAEEMERLFLEWERMSRKINMAAIESWLRDQLAILRWFIADDWFSSLWTLQEAFLSPKAIFMFKDGLSPEFLNLCLNGEGEFKLFRLESFIGTWQMYRKICKDPGFKDCILAKELSNTITEIGFIDGLRDQHRRPILDDIEYPTSYMGNPLGLLVASKLRSTTREVDRVYGIMQVFGLRLGKSAPEATGKDFTLEELQVQLATEILIQYPIFSQLIVQDEDCTVPKSWMINPSITLPDVAYLAWSHQSCGGKVISTVTMSTEIHCSETWASFKGRAIGFKLLQETISSRVNQASLGVYFTLDKGARKEMTAKMGRKVETAKETMDGLLKIYKGVQVLLLGFLAFPDGFQRRTDDIMKFEIYYWGVGLLLVELHGSGGDGKHRHARLGVVTWDIEILTKAGSDELSPRALDLVKGNGIDWIYIEGLFG